MWQSDFQLWQQASLWCSLPSACEQLVRWSSNWRKTRRFSKVPRDAFNASLHRQKTTRTRRGQSTLFKGQLPFHNFSEHLEVHVTWSETPGLRELLVVAVEICSWSVLITFFCYIAFGHLGNSRHFAKLHNVSAVGGQFPLFLRCCGIIWNKTTHISEWPKDLLPRGPKNAIVSAPDRICKLN